MSDFLFTSESVSEGHPDKVADQISDAVLDAILAQDKHGRVAAETLVTHRPRGHGRPDHHQRATSTTRELARDVIKRIGYDDSSIGFDYTSCARADCLTTSSRRTSRRAWTKARGSISSRARATRA